VTSGLIIVAAGSASRMGGIDKVWADLGGMPLLQWSIDRLGPFTDAIVVVVRADDLVTARERLRLLPQLRIVPGGAERSDSVRAGLAALLASDVIAVHDAARPFAHHELLLQGTGCLATAAGAVPGEPVRDTIKEVGSADRVVRTVDRNRFRAIQTPQVFRADILRAAHAGSGQASDDSALVEQLGATVACFPGHAENFKITTPFDLTVARLLVQNNLIS